MSSFHELYTAVKMKVYFCVLLRSSLKNVTNAGCSCIPKIRVTSAFLGDMFYDANINK